jgi:fucose permease
MVFLWFFILSVPTGILQDRFGKRRVLNAGIIITGIGMVVPYVSYTFPAMLVAFVLLGIGNTIVQVAANPLLQEVVPPKKFSSFMSLSQFIKAIVSMAGPIIAASFAMRAGNWKLVFTIYAFTSFLAAIWLGFTKIEELKGAGEPASFKSCFKLLGNPFVLVMVIAIFLIVGSDVGVNSNLQSFLSSKFGISLEKASYGISIYFAALMISRFLGAVILNFIKPRLFLIITAFISIIGVLFIIFSPTYIMAYVAVFIIGFGSGNLFPLVFSIAVNRMPERANEISGLMIMAVSGGALIPPIMGLVSQAFGAVASIFVIGICLIYVTLVAIFQK